MPTISQYFNPCSREFHTCRDFKTLTIKQRIGVVLLTALATICSIGLLSFAVTRLLVTRFAKWNIRDLPQASLKTHILAKNIILTNTQPAETVTPPPVVPIFSKTVAPPPMVPILLNNEPLNTPSPSIEQTPPPLQVPPLVPQSVSRDITPSERSGNYARINAQRDIFYDFNGKVSIENDGMHLELAGPIIVDYEGTRYHFNDHVLFDDKNILIPKKPQKQSVFFDTVSYTSPSKYKFPVPSPTSQITRQFIQNHLKSFDKTSGDSIDNKDCFIHAFCQVISILKGTKVEVSDSRKQMQRGLGKQNWLEGWFKQNRVQETLTDYTAKLSNQNAFLGYPQREGRLLCEIHKVNLKVYKAVIFGLTDAQATPLISKIPELAAFLNPSPMMGPSPFSFYESKDEAIIVPGATETVEMVAYSVGKVNYYLPIFDLSKLLS